MGFVRTTPQGAEYAEQGHQVVVKSDGSILVRPGDSLSKYSMAIYGDFSNIDRKFGRSVSGRVRSFRDLNANINLIRSGETIYQMNRFKTGGGKPAGEETVSIKPGAPPIPKSVLTSRLNALFKYLQQVMMPTSDWEITGSDGIGVGAGSIGVKLGGAGSFMRYWAKRPQDSAPVTISGFSLGGSAGFNPDPCPIDVTIAPSTFDSKGWILKGPGAGATLSKAELGGAILSIEVSARAIGGGSAIMILGAANVTDFLTNPMLGIGRLAIAKWMIASGGCNISNGVDLSATLSFGYLYAR